MARVDSIVVSRNSISLNRFVPGNRRTLAASAANRRRSAERERCRPRCRPSKPPARTGGGGRWLLIGRLAGVAAGGPSISVLGLYNIF